MVKRFLFSASFIFLLWATATAQVLVTQLPVNPARLSLDDLWEITLFNPGTEEVVSLHLTITNEGRQLIRLHTDDFSLPNGQTIIHNGMLNFDITDFDANHPYAQQVVSSRNLPFGEYDICVKVMDGTGAEKGENCLEHAFNPLTPPQLMYPDYCADLATKNPLFSWLPPTPVVPGQEIIYDLKVCEVFPGQSHQDAIDNNNPHYTAANLTTTTHAYPMGGDPFDTTKTYVWQVSARMNKPMFGEWPKDGNSFRGLGVSEVWCFHWKKEEKTPVLPNTYIYPKNITDGGFSNVENVFYLAYSSQKQQGNIQVSFLNEKGETVALNYSLAAIRGDNRYELNLRESGEFKHNGLYTLVLTDVHGKQFTIRFRYLEK